MERHIKLAHMSFVPNRMFAAVEIAAHAAWTGACAWVVPAFRRGGAGRLRRERIRS